MLFIEPSEPRVAVDFEEVSAEGKEVVPDSSAGEGFASSGGVLDALDTSDDVFEAALFFALEVTVALEGV